MEEALHSSTSSVVVALKASLAEEAEESHWTGGGA